MSEQNNAPECVFVAKHLSKVYKMGDVHVHALRDVSLKLYKGEFVVLLGTSGSGKSTLLNILGGLDTATSGTVCYNDKELSHASDKELTQYRREHVGFVFQFYNLIPSLTALENVKVVTDIAIDPMPLKEALSMVGLEGRYNHFPAQLSGGEQQRVAIARAIAKRPAVMLCDEPTGALDSKTGIKVLQALEAINTQLNTTVIIITHNADIARMAQRVLWMQDGQIVREEINENRINATQLSW